MLLQGLALFEQGLVRAKFKSIQPRLPWTIRVAPRLTMTVVDIFLGEWAGCDHRPNVGIILGNYDFPCAE
jgi:hypothetical protein